MLEGNLANTLSGKFAALEYFNRLEERVELPVKAPIVQGTLRRYCTVPCSRKNAPLYPLTVLVRYAFDGGNFHPFMGSGGEGLVAVLVSELFFSAAIGRDVHRRFRSGELGALPDPG